MNDKIKQPPDGEIIKTPVRYDSDSGYIESSTGFVFCDISDAIDDEDLCDEVGEHIAKVLNEYPALVSKLASARAVIEFAEETTRSREYSWDETLNDLARKWLEENGE